ncbi:MAG: lactate utilization protein [Desulfobacteraceae bacterium]|nr:lactate utilization protein [Desulfobacteraceae bacterium]
MEKAHQSWLYEKHAEVAIKNLRRNCFEAKYLPTAEAAFDEIMGRVTRETCIGMGDSLTLREIGVVKALEEEGYQLLNPWEKGISRPESMPIRRKALTSDVFLTGTNAVTMDGKLVSIDGLGNRVAGMIFGPLKVIVAVGANKLVNNVQEAIDRIKKISAPVNAYKHDYNSAYRPPCSDTGICSDCRPPARMCCNTAIIEGCSRDRERICVLIIGQSLGF